MNTPRNHGKEWTKQVDEILLNYQKNGHNNQHIAFCMERTESDIECRLAYLKEKEKPIITRENAKKYLSILYAFSKGEAIEMLSGTTWLPLTAFMFTKPIENYRVKPKWYRVAKMQFINTYSELANNEETEENLETDDGFICWLTERIEYT